MSRRPKARLYRNPHNLFENANYDTWSLAFESLDGFLDLPCAPYISDHETFSLEQRPSKTDDDSTTHSD